MKIKLTEWFPAKINPVHTGLYQVHTRSWPWAQLIEYDATDGGWFIDHGEQITKWRGLTLEQESPKKEEE